MAEKRLTFQVREAKTVILEAPTAGPADKAEAKPKGAGPAPGDGGKSKSEG